MHQGMPARTHALHSRFQPKLVEVVTPSESLCLAWSGQAILQDHSNEDLVDPKRFWGPRGSRVSAMMVRLISFSPALLPAMCQIEDPKTMTSSTVHSLITVFQLRPISHTSVLIFGPRLLLLTGHCLTTVFKEYQ